MFLFHLLVFLFLCFQVWAYPVSPYDGLSCHWYRYDMATSKRWIQTCSQEDLGREWFLLEFWYEPSRTVVVECKQGHPFVPGLFDLYDTAEFDTFVFLRCPMSNLTFSQILSGISVKKFAFSSYHPLFQFPISLIQEFSMLHLLNLKHNAISAIPEGYLSGLSVLKVLTLAFNSISDLPSDLIRHLSLEHIDVSDNLLSELDEDFFLHQIRLQTLLLARNKFDKFKDGIFRTLVSLRYLDISDNYLFQIKPEIFLGLPKIYKIIFKNNRLEDIPESIFRNNKNLAVLDISSNPSLSLLPDNLLRDLELLKDLEMSNCNVSSIPNHFFKGVFNLRWLSFTRNQLSTIPENAFRNLSRLKTVDLKSNQISSLPRHAFANLKNLRFLILENNALEKLEHQEFKGLDKLTSLNLAHNQIEYISEGSFDDLHRLEKLNLKGNLIRNLPLRNPFGPGHRLRMVDLSVNNCSVLPRLMPEQYRELNYLNLDRNQIQHVDLPVLQSDLSQISLRHNRIESVNVTEFPQGSLGAVFLEDNPLVCDCSLRDFADFLRSDASRGTFPNAHALTCASPAFMADTRVVDAAPILENGCGEEDSNSTLSDLSNEVLDNDLEMGPALS